MRLLVCIVFCLLSYRPVFSQGWERRYAAGGGPCAGSQLDVSSTGGFVVTAAIHTDIPTATDIWLFKTDDFGLLEWSKVIEMPGENVAMDIKETSGGHFVVGSTRGADNGDWDILLMLTDPVGDTIWTLTFGGPYDEIVNSICVVDDGFVVSGTMTYGTGNSEVLLLKVDTHGVISWYRTYGYPNEAERSYCVIQTADGGFAIAGSTTAFTQYREGYLVKTDSEGNWQWSTHFGETLSTQLSAVVQLESGEFFVAGRRRWDSSNLEYQYYAKLNILGDVIWDEQASPGFIESLILLPTNEIVLCGSYDVHLGDARDGAIIKIDENGDEIWSHRYGLWKSDALSAIEQTPDGGYVAVGFQYDPYFWAPGVYLVKTDSKGITAPLALKDPELKEAIVFPNPSAGNVTFFNSGKDAGHYSYVLIDLQGKQVDSGSGAITDH